MCIRIYTCMLHKKHFQSGWYQMLLFFSLLLLLSASIQSKNNESVGASVNECVSFEMHDFRTEKWSNFCQQDFNLISIKLSRTMFYKNEYLRIALTSTSVNWTTQSIWKQDNITYHDFCFCFHCCWCLCSPAIFSLFLLYIFLLQIFLFGMHQNCEKEM